MIGKLRAKIVGISLLTVTLVLAVGLTAVVLSVRGALVRSSEQQLYAALEKSVFDLVQPGESGSTPCFVATVYADGTVRLSGSSYYQLDDEDTLRSIIQQALDRQDDGGVLRQYSLRYLRVTGPLTVRIAFADCSYEQRAVRALLWRSVLMGLAALAALAAGSYALSGMAVRPVQRAWQEQRQFLSDASHELKTPLTVILSSADLMAEEQEQDKLRRYGDNIRSEARRMKTLVEDMLTLARAENGTKTPEETLNLSDVVLESVLAFEPVAFETRRHMSYDITPELTVQGHGTQLRQVADILLDNAVKYAPPETEIRTVLCREGRSAVLTVENGGTPIPAEKLAHLFDRFYRVDESRTGGQGFGLGLAIAQSLVQGHRGTIGCTSDEGGTRFTVRLPLTRGQTSTEKKEKRG